jgi:hypothetical protein
MVTTITHHLEKEIPNLKCSFYIPAVVSNIKEEFEIKNLDFDTIPSHMEKCCLIYKSEPGIHCHRAGDVESITKDMVSVAVKIKLDSTPLSDLTRDEKIKVSEIFSWHM